MPQLSIDMDSQGRSISERDIQDRHSGRERREPAANSRPCTAAQVVSHEVNAKPIYDAAKSIKRLSPRVSSSCRVDSPAHFYDAVDFVTSDNHAAAKELSKKLGGKYFVQVEEWAPNGKQRDTKYVHGVAQTPVEGDPKKDFTGNHVHVQTDKHFRPKASSGSSRQEPLPPR